MQIKIKLTSRLSFYFCGSIALSLANPEVTVDSDKLTKQEVVGLHRATKSQIVSIVEGSEKFTELFEQYTSKTKFKKEEVATVETETKVEVKEEIKEEVKVETTEEVKEEVKVAEEEVKPKTTTRKRTTTATAKK